MQSKSSYNRSRKKKRKRKNRNRVIAARLTFLISLVVLVALLFIGVTKIIASVSDNIVSDADVSTVAVQKNGSIKQTIIEEFDPGVYDEASLEAEIKERVEASDGGVEYEGFSLDDNVATLRLKFKTDEDLAAFHDQVFYADTIDSLLSQGVSFDSGAVKAGGSHAVIVSESMDVRCPRKILYTGGNVTVDEDDGKLAHCTAENGELAFVIY